MGRRNAAVGATRRFEVGPFWLWYRNDRDDWNICWLDSAGGRSVTRRASTGVGGGGEDPPEPAKEALIDHWTEWKARRNDTAPQAAAAPGDVLLADVTACWLEEHVAQLEAPGRYLTSIDSLEAFWAELRAKGECPEPLSVLSITGKIVDRFIAWRRTQGASAPTVSRDLAALRGPINWGLKNGLITAAPFVKDVKGKGKRKDLEWDPRQIAAILDAAAASPEREHVLLFSLIMLSTHGRGEAVLELDADTQIRRGMIHFLRPDETQTRKRRSIVPIAPTLAPWLDGRTGKVIRYRVPTSARSRAKGAPEFHERLTADIGNAFDGVLLAAHEANPALGLARQARDRNRQPLWLDTGEPRLRGNGSPNTLRHTIHTWLKTEGVPDAQINAAAGHSEEGTGKNYTHLRPDYLREFIASVERFWAAVGEHTDVHRRYQRDTKSGIACVNHANV